MSILDQILQYKHEEVRSRRAVIDPGHLAARIAAAPAPRGFLRALEERRRALRPALICEIKKASPSKGLIRANFDPPVHARAYQAGGAACLSVLTDTPSFQGCDDDLRTASAACTLPILRKDFMVDPWQVDEARALGADAILVIMSAVDDATALALVSAARHHGMDVLVEVHDHRELERAVRLGTGLIGVNNRNLRTFEVSLHTTLDLLPHVPDGVVLVTESGIAGARDVADMIRSGVGAFLVGESLMRQADVEQATRALADVVVDAGPEHT
jgi:indole-3-glycerol phosphate synthase